MSPRSSKRIVMASAVCIGFVFISEVSVSTAYSPRLPANIPKGCSINQVFDHKDSQQDISDAHLVDDDDLNRKHSRRGFMKTGLTAVFPFLMTAALTTPTTRANAFDNRKDDKYADVVPTPGKQPGDLGYSQRSNYFGLKQCGTSPNCWNSSTPKANIPARWLPSWEANGRSIDDVKKIIETYEVGHDEIDGGGFKVIEYKKKSSDDQYLYVQFQSYKAGYIDDFECWFNPESKKFDVRSSSRVGYSDLGVNALRLEYIASRLEKEYGWTFERRKNGKLV